MSDRPMPSSFDENDDFYNERPLSKIVRKLKEEPLIPIGCLLTVAAFTNAYRAMKRGDHAKVQKYFRARVLAQGFTIVAMVVGGMYYSADRHRQKELWKLKREQEAEEKRQKWIRELEIRDEEDRAVREMMNKRRKKVEEKGTDKDDKENEGKVSVLEAVKAADAKKAEEGKGSWGGWFGGSKKEANNAKTDEPPAKIAMPEAAKDTAAQAKK